MLKRFVCLLLAISLCAIPFIVPQAAEGLDVLPQNITFLQDLGILEQIPEVGLYERRIYYTREKLAKTLSMMLLTSEPVIVQEPEIRDVEGNSFINYIDFAVTQGLMQLDNKLLFHPADYVTLDMAVYGMVRALEYHPLAEAAGGTPEAYISVAADIGILRNVDIENPDHITIFELGKMVNNAMRITPMIQQGEIITCIKPTFLEQKELYKKSGRILANTNIGLSIDKAPRGYVNIDGKLYPTKLAIEDITVGAIVTYYTQKIDNKEYVVSYYATSDEGVLSLDADEIDSVAFSGTNVKLTYNDAEDEAVIDRRAFVLVNGKNYSLSRELFDVFKSGTINMRDSDDNGVYDVVYMDLYRTEVVNAVGADAQNIITKYYSQSIKLEPVGEGLRIIRENTELDISQLAIGQVISVACDDFAITNGQLVFNYNTAKKMTIRVSDKTVAGVVTQMVDGGNYIVVDDIKYEASTYLKKAYTDGKISAVQPGQPVVLHLDIYDKVVYHEVDAKENLMEYGYLIDAALNTQGLNKNLMLKLLCEDGKIRIYDAAKSYLLNGVSVKKHSLTGEYGENLDVRQLIRYRVQNDTVKEIDTAQINPMVESTENSLSRDFTSGAESLSYRFGNFGWKVVMMATTPAFNVPDPNATTVDDSMFTRVSTATTVQDKSYKIDAYDMDDRLVAGCILRYSATVAANYGDKDTIYMIKDICRAVGPDGLPTTQLTLLGGREEDAGESIVYFADDVDCRLNHNKQYGNASAEKTGNELTPADFKRGDLIRYLIDDYGMVSNIERVFRYSADEPTKAVAYGSGGAYGVSYSAFKYSTTLSYMTVCMNKDVVNAVPEEFNAIPTSRFVAVPVYNVAEDEVYLETKIANTPSYTAASNTMLYMQTYTSEIMGVFAYCLD